MDITGCQEPKAAMPVLGVISGEEVVAVGPGVLDRAAPLLEGHAPGDLIRATLIFGARAESGTQSIGMAMSA
jgi:hypothetical protein